MAYEQPRVPIWREEKLTDYIKELVRFLRSFTVAAWTADKTKDIEISNIRKIVDGKPAGLSAQETVDLIYPKGRVIISFEDENPNELYPWQKWERISGGRFLLGASSSYPLGSTGGEEKHKLTVDELAKHGHGTASDWTSYPDEWPAWQARIAYFQSAEVTYHNKVYTENSGGNQPHNNMPPYLAVNMWQRVA